MRMGLVKFITGVLVGLLVIVSGTTVTLVIAGFYVTVSVVLDMTLPLKIMTAITGFVVMAVLVSWAAISYRRNSVTERTARTQSESAPEPERSSQSQ